MESYIAIVYTADEPNAGMLGALLMEMGFEGIEENEQDQYAASVRQSLYNEAEVKQIFKHFGLAYSCKIIEPQNWNAIWESGFQPVQVDDFACIRARFHPAVTGVLHDIIVTPKMSFGTGHHATTYMMIAEMKHLNLQQKNVIDFGTGTGVLAILAEKLGATEILAVDNDEWSIENATENIMVNGCKNIHIQMAHQMPENFKADMILANINLNVIVANMAVIKKVLYPGGVVLFSGIMVQDKETITTAIEKEGLKINKIRERNGWLLISTSTY